LGNLPDPYTGAKPTQETGMPAGAMWKNQWGEGYAYDFKNTIITPTGYIPSPSLLNPIRQQQAIASAKAEDWEGLGLSVASTPILMSRAPIMSVAPIMSAATSDRGMTPTQPTQAQVKAAQQAYIDARTHLGTPIGTAARNYDFQNPNSIIQTPGGIQVTDERGVVVTDTSAIINQSDKARREAEILKSSTKSY
jgi:hypothetical protein